MKTDPTGPTVRKFLGMFTRRERWGLSWRGWLALTAGLLLAGWIWVLHVHPFLAVTRPVPARILVVEGWTHGYGVKAAMREFNNGHYDRIFTTGGPVEGTGNPSSITDTTAAQSAALLKKSGLPENLVQSVPCCFVGRDRTYNSALALRDWLQAHAIQPGSLNVITEDAHARRTWLLFQEALGPEVHVGIISAEDPDYDAEHWWRSSEGVREIIDESVAYVYARFFFFPPARDAKPG